MNNQEVNSVVNRLDNIILSLRNQNSAADCHTVGNMRNTASLLKEQLLSPYPLEDALIHRIVDNCEKQLVMFFRKKYYKHQSRLINTASMNWERNAKR